MKSKESRPFKFDELIQRDQLLEKGSFGSYSGTVARYHATIWKLARRIAELEKRQ